MAATQKKRASAEMDQTAPKKSKQLHACESARGKGSQQKVGLQET